MKGLELLGYLLDGGRARLKAVAQELLCRIHRIAADGHFVRPGPEVPRRHIQSRPLLGNGEG